ncbi:MAG: hypothetical protein KDJ22_02325 [Candidatus Competibacteraceae bacterium]|nr:hypothetical protein [Candidatus Competibacteraceae bacterium]MCP5124894.1 hypothetical protein [Gammaproteobacteria bacterium]HRX70998.1 formate dehydrogenase N subunit beta transmembrane domain-containing protein [Candidatus Competibacteraceae bacterium]
MKYLAIAVLVAIIAGALFHYVRHRDDVPPAESAAGWEQR